MQGIRVGMFEYKLSYFIKLAIFIFDRFTTFKYHKILKSRISISYFVLFQSKAILICCCCYLTLSHSEQLYFVIWFNIINMEDTSP